MNKEKHEVSSVIISLRKKGVVITLEEPLTKNETGFEPIKIEDVKARAKQLEIPEEKVAQLFLLGTLLDTLGITPKKVTFEKILQAPYTVNISKAHDLGNGSWGKIDFLINHNNFNLVKHFTEDVDISNSINIEGYDKKKQKKIYNKFQTVSERDGNRKKLV